MLILLLTPSAFSGFIDVVTGIAVTISTIIISSFQSSSFQQELFNYRSGQTANNLTYGSQRINQGLDSNLLLSNLPLLLFWALVGTVIYLFATSVVGALRNAAEFQDELEFVNADRNDLLKTAIFQLSIRLGVVFVWIFYIRFFFHSLLPYSIAAAHAASSVGLVSINGLAYALLAFLVLVIGMHIHTVFFRTLLLKPRIFTKAYYLD